MSTYKAFACDTVGFEVKLTDMPIVPLDANSVRMAPVAASLCMSDLHSMCGDWQIPLTLDGTKDKIVPSHEVVGIITELGANVTDLKIGQRVGLGWQAGSCQSCDLCEEELEPLCKKHAATIYTPQCGGCAETLVCQAHFAIPIPDTLSSTDATSLFCAGITAWNPIHRFEQHYKTRKIPIKRTRVVVQGLGGVGSVAVKFLVALGYETYAITRSADKLAFAQELGCKDIIVSTDAESMAKVQNTFDFVLNTASAADEDCTPLLKLLRPRGVYAYVVLGAPSHKWDATLVVFAELTIFGSLIGSPKLIKEMLAFAAEKGIKPIIEVEKLKFDEEGCVKVNQSIQDLHNGKVRFRRVLEFQQE